MTQAELVSGMRNHQSKLPAAVLTEDAFIQAAYMAEVLSNAGLAPIAATRKAAAIAYNLDREDASDLMAMPVR